MSITLAARSQRQWSCGEASVWLQDWAHRWLGWLTQRTCPGAGDHGARPSATPVAQKLCSLLGPPRCGRLCVHDSLGTCCLRTAIRSGPSSRAPSWTDDRIAAARGAVLLHTSLAAAQEKCVGGAGSRPTKREDKLGSSAPRLCCCRDCLGRRCPKQPSTSTSTSRSTPGAKPPQRHGRTNACGYGYGRVRSALTTDDLPALLTRRIARGRDECLGRPRRGFRRAACE
jgi:hypothetical protein